MTRPSFYARYAFLILLATAFLLPLALGGARRALRGNRNDVKQWLPATYDETHEFEWFRQHFAGEQFVLVSWVGCTLDDPRLALFPIKLIPPVDAEPWSKEPGLFAKVVTGPRLIEELADTLVRHGGKKSDDFTPEQLREQARAEAIRRLQGLLIGPDGRQTCAVVTLSEAGTQNLRKCVDALRSTAIDLCAVAPADLRMGGPPVDNVALDVTGEQSLYRLAGLAAVIGLVVSWWCLRRLRLVAMVFATGIMSAALALAIVWYSGGTVNAILLTMPSLVYVAAISAAIHLANYYRETVAEHGLEGAPGRAVRHAALPLSLATGTTAVGLMSLWISELVPIQMFGLYAAIGVIAATVPLVLFLPAALHFWPITPSAQHSNGIGVAAQDRPATWTNPIEALPWSAVGNGIVRRQGWVLAATALTLGFCGWGLTKVQTSVNLMRFFAPDSEIVQHYGWLEQNLGPLVPMEVVVRFDDRECKLNMLERLELVQRVQAKIETLPEVGSAMSAATFAPKLPGGKGYSLKRSITNKRLLQSRQALIEGDYLKQSDGEELWRISARVPALNYDLDYGRFIQEVQRQVDPLLQQERNRGASGVRPAVYTGLVPLIYKAQNSLLDGLIWGFIGDWVLIALVMMLVVRAWSAGLLLMLPSAFPAVVVFGLMGWLGIVVDTGTVMTPAVALGVTVDDVVHFMLWYRAGLMQGLDRRKSILLAYKGCAQAMYQSWGVIGLGLAVFALSPFMPTQRFGYLMVTLLSVSLVGNLVVLPALLASPLGVLFSWRVDRQRQRLAARLQGLRADAAHDTPVPHTEAPQPQHHQRAAA